MPLTFFIDLGLLRLILYLNGRNIPFVHHVKYLGVIFDKRITRRLQIEMKSKAFRTFIRIYPLLKNERLSANIKLTFHKALIGSVMIYNFHAWELVADTHLLKTQPLQNKVLPTIGKFPRCTPVHDLHTDLNLLYCHMPEVP
jgi:hypothetical protein